MDYQRAEQILRSPDVIQVFYNDKSVWLEELNQNKNTALVSTGAINGQRMTVAIEELKEKH